MMYAELQEQVETGCRLCRCESGDPPQLLTPVQDGRTGSPCVRGAVRIRAKTVFHAAIFGRWL